MTAELAIVQPPQAPDLTAIERVIVTGDLSKLTADERWNYYRGVCQSVGLNPFTQPFLYITLSGKLVLYATKGAADQLRSLHHISITQPRVEMTDGLCMVTVTATDRTGRSDSELGIVPIENLRGDAKANAILKAITKAKRRVTLSMCGLGMLDETEVETIPNAVKVDVPVMPDEDMDPPETARRPHPLQDRMNARRVAEEDGRVTKDNEGPSDTPEPAAQPTVSFDREGAEAEYKELRNRAVKANHPHSQKLKEKLTSSLTDDVLTASIQSLEAWLEVHAPSDEMPF